jgi:hypothetical protein
MSGRQRPACYMADGFRGVVQSIGWRQHVAALADEFGDVSERNPDPGRLPAVPVHDQPHPGARNLGTAHPGGSARLRDRHGSEPGMPSRRHKATLILRPRGCRSALQRDRAKTWLASLPVHQKHRPSTGASLSRVCYCRAAGSSFPRRASTVWAFQRGKNDYLVLSFEGAGLDGNSYFEVTVPAIGFFTGAFGFFASLFPRRCPFAIVLFLFRFDVHRSPATVDRAGRAYCSLLRWMCPFTKWKPARSYANPG